MIDLTCYKTFVFDCDGVILNSNKKDQWITLIDAIEYTSLSDSSIRRAFYRGKLKASRVTGKLLFKISELEKWLSNE